ncbi:HNH endonuclease [Pseudomonas sp. Z1-29]|uniref:HNH endonuclease n=1 Tax=Pseudomonas sp. Z1-29 TaxID=2817410 RepID=UPI003DA8B755
MQEAALQGYLREKLEEPKVYQPHDVTVFVPVGRYASSPGWCFLPWKGLDGAYKWGFKARPEISDYFSALIGLQKAFLTDEVAQFKVIKKGLRVVETQRRARWRDGAARPNLLYPRQGWIEVPVSELESLGLSQRQKMILEPHVLNPRLGGLESFTERATRVRNFQGNFSLGTSALWAGRCAITGSSLALEAAHLKPVGVCEEDDPALTDPYNGILLTASLHRLMDAGVIGFDSDRMLVVDPELSFEERTIHQLVGAHKIDFRPEAMKYLQHRIKRT